MGRRFFLAAAASEGDRNHFSTLSDRSIGLSIIVILFQALFRLVTGQLQSDLTTVISTLVTAILFTPLRERIQKDIDSRFYRRKYDADQMLREFAGRAREEIELEQLTQNLLSAVDDTLQPSQLSVWLFNQPVKR